MYTPLLRGINFGGWLSQTIFTPEHLETFITENDVAHIRSWGFNCIRLPLDHCFLTPSGQIEDIIPQHWKYLDRFLAWIEKYQLYLILDLHTLPGHSFITPAENTIWNKGESLRLSLELWTYIAERYRTKGTWLLYDILNEPVASEPGEWNQLAGMITSAIRAVDPVHTLIIESNTWANTDSFNELLPTGDPNSIYSFHFYEPIFFTHQNAHWVPWSSYFQEQIHYPGRIDSLLKIALEHLDNESFINTARQRDKFWSRQALQESLKPALNFREKYQTPLFCGEWGAIPHAPRYDRLLWYKDVLDILNEHKIGWTIWNYKNLDFGLINNTEPYKNQPEYSRENNLDQELLELLQKND